MSDLMKFEFEGSGVRLVEKDGEPWFVAKDVCDVLGISNVPDAVGRLDADERNTIAITDSIRRGNPNVNIISESGLYGLIMVSRKPEAQDFKRWVRKEVLPQIRKTGQYAAGPAALPKTYLEALEALVVVERERLALAAKNEEMSPKADIYDLCMDNNTPMTFTEAAHYLNYGLSGRKGQKLGRNTLARILHDEDILFMHSGRSRAYQEYVSKGYFVERQVPVSNGESNSNRPQLMFTQKGLVWLADFLLATGHCFRFDDASGNLDLLSSVE